MSEPFIGLQISPVCFLDEGIEPLLDTLQRRFGVTVLMPGTVSWLGLKVGRRTSHAVEGFPDHGVAEPWAGPGGAYHMPRAEYYAASAVRNFRAPDKNFAGIDILEAILPAARARGMAVIPELMEPAFRAENPPAVEGLAAVLEVDIDGRVGPEPCTSNPGWRGFWHGVFNEHAREYHINGVMWCNERHSPLDRMMLGRPPGCFCTHCVADARAAGINVGHARRALGALWSWFQKARAGAPMPDGALIEFLRVLLAHPEALLWERRWLERSKALDRELHGIVKRADPAKCFGLNVWNRNHFNPLRRAQWDWESQTEYADFVKPITYQHQAGNVFANEMAPWGATLLRDTPIGEYGPAIAKLLGIALPPWERLVETGLDADSYVFDEATATLRGVGGRAKVYMGIGVDAPRLHDRVARCTPDIVRRSVLAAYRAGAHGVVFSPNYATMNHTTLDGAAAALRELGLMPHG